MSARSHTRVTPASTLPIPTHIPVLGGPTLTPADVAAITAAVVPVIASMLAPAQFTPSPVVQAAPVAPARKTAKVTYRTRSGSVKTATPAQFAHRQTLANGTLVPVDATTPKAAKAGKAPKAPKAAKAPRTPKADTPAWIVEHGIRKGDRKALSALLRTQLGRPYTHEEWVAAKAEHGIA